MEGYLETLAQPQASTGRRLHLYLGHCDLGETGRSSVRVQQSQRNRC